MKINLELNDDEVKEIYDFAQEVLEMQGKILGELQSITEQLKKNEAR